MGDLTLSRLLWILAIIVFLGVAAVVLVGNRLKASVLEKQCDRLTRTEAQIEPAQHGEAAPGREGQDLCTGHAGEPGPTAGGGA